MKTPQHWFGRKYLSDPWVRIGDPLETLITNDKLNQTALCLRHSE